MSEWSERRRKGDCASAKYASDIVAFMINRSRLFSIYHSMSLCLYLSCVGCQDGQTLLHVAAKHGHVDTVRLLVSFSSSVIPINGQDMSGNTALHLAYRNGYDEVFAFARAFYCLCVCARGRCADECLNE